MSLIWTSHATHIYACVLHRKHTRQQGWSILETWLIHMCDKTHWCVCHDSLIDKKTTRLERQRTRDTASYGNTYVWRDLFLCFISLLHSYVSYHSFIPPDKLRLASSSTLYTLFCLICTIHSELTYLTICTGNKWAGLDIHWFLGDRFDTLWIPSRFSCGTESTHGNKGEGHSNHTRQ